MTYDFRPFSVFYLERKYLEDNVRKEINKIKKTLANENIAIETSKELKSNLNFLKTRRPCVIVWVHGSNIIVMPITKEDNHFHLKIDPIDPRFPESYIKFSNISTYSVEKFSKISSSPKKGTNKKISLEDRENLREIFYKTYRL